jgi:hypothetical protein
MLITNDIGNLFEAMRTAYGNQWKHGTDAINVWRNALNRFSPEDLQRAAEACLEIFVDYPPTLPQFIKVLDPGRERPNTYLPPPPMVDGQAMANRLMLVILRNCGGVDIETLRKMARVKIRAVRELDRKPDEQFLIDLEQEFNRLADAQDHQAKKQEVIHAHEAFCVRQGVPMSKVRHTFS